MDIIDTLESTRSRTLKHFDLGEDLLDRTYGPGKWSIRFVLHHMADTETVLYDRIRRAIGEPRQVVWAFDPDAWAAGLDYAHVPLDHSRRIYDAVRSGIIHQARGHYQGSDSRQFVHSLTGLRTLKDEFDKVAAHNESHLTQIETALRA